MARLVSRIIYNAPPLGAATSWIMFPFIAIIGMALSGIFDVWIDDVEVLRLMWLPFGAYGLFSLVGPLTYRLNSLDPLPIGRRFIFALLTLPALLAFCLGYGLSGGRQAHRRPRPEPGRVPDRETLLLGRCPRRLLRDRP